MNLEQRMRRDTLLCRKKTAEYVGCGLDAKGDYVEYCTYHQDSREPVHCTRMGQLVYVMKGEGQFSTPVLYYECLSSAKPVIIKRK